MDRQALITRFEAEMSKITRPGVDKLMDYIRKSDFYIAPASTKYHLACEGGLLQHSLNVLDALRGLLDQTDDKEYSWIVAGRMTDIIPAESVTVAALLHDICKTYFYTTSTRNVKNENTGRWEKVPFYTVDDKMPLGHGSKSAMIVKQYMELTTPEMYAIWHHMGFTGDRENNTAVGVAFEKYPLALALHMADVIASRIMEANAGNKPLFLQADPEPESVGEHADNPATEAPPTQDPAPAEADWQEAPPLQEGA